MVALVISYLAAFRFPLTLLQLRFDPGAYGSDRRNDPSGLSNVTTGSVVKAV